MRRFFHDFFFRGLLPNTRIFSDLQAQEGSRRPPPPTTPTLHNWTALLTVAPPPLSLFFFL